MRRERYEHAFAAQPVQGGGLQGGLAAWRVHTLGRRALAKIGAATRGTGSVVLHPPAPTTFAISRLAMRSIGSKRTR